ncbi:MAG: single-stranded DNA-binding protein [Candidatus Dojkabacteria bacterium]|nr:single-stranded DNA-binding protein [Candidatus Dojkabacteria bacterium]
MFGDINKIELMGNVVRDPELRFTPSGAAVLNFSLATNRSYRVGEEWKDEVSFHNIVVWRNAESLAKRLQKGTRVFLEGRSHTRSWDSDDGKKNYRTEVIVDKVILISRYTGGEGRQQRI